jgi:hypothetical protein
MCMAGTQNMTQGAAQPTGGNVYPGPYTSNQAPPPAEDTKTPDEKVQAPPAKVEGAGDSEDESKAYDRTPDEAKVWNYTKIASGGRRK